MSGCLFQFCSDIDVYPPFAPITQQRSTHITYLDSIGRPAVTLSFENLTDMHNGMIYVSARTVIWTPLTSLGRSHIRFRYRLIYRSLRWCRLLSLPCSLSPFWLGG